MALMKLSTFMKRFKQGDAPDPRTVVSWIDKGYIYGEVYGPKSIYVDPDRAPEKTTSNELVLKVLSRMGTQGGKHNGAATHGQT